MANVFAVHSVGSSLANYLTTSYPEPLRTDHPCIFRVMASGELDTLDPEDLGTALTFILYRVTINEHLRNSRVFDDQLRNSIPLSLDLHYLMVVWANSALAEHTILAWAMRQLHQHPLLDTSYLTPEAGWSTGDVVQIVPEELSTDDLMTIWDALSRAYRLSVSYTARVVRIETEPIEEAGPVVATRFSYTDREALP